MGRFVLGTPTPEARQGHIKSAGAVLKSAAGFDEGSLKVQPAATVAAWKVQPAATKAACKVQPAAMKAASKVQPAAAEAAKKCSLLRRWPNLEVQAAGYEFVTSFRRFGG